MATDPGSVAIISLADIRENKAALREVDRTAMAYSELVDSIASVGILNPILVREDIDPETQEKFYALIDGLHRVMAAKDAGLEVIPALIKDIEKGHALIAQMMTNLHKIETKPHEYAKGIRRVLATEPTLTITELAQRISVSPSWISKRLGLLKLTPQIAALVDEGKINLVKGFVLAKLPEEEQGNFVDSAMTQPADEFVKTVQDRVKSLREARRQGKDADPVSFVPVPKLRKIKEIDDEITNGATAVTLCEGVEDAVEIFKLALNWVLSLDGPTLAQRQEDYNARQKQREVAKDRRVAERKATKEAKAAEEAASIDEAADDAENVLDSLLK